MQRGALGGIARELGDVGIPEDFRACVQGGIEQEIEQGGAMRARTEEAAAEFRIGQVQQHAARFRTAVEF